MSACPASENSAALPAWVFYLRLMRPPDAAFADPAQAVLYDLLDPDRSDLEAYVAIARDVAARRVVDVGCGTGCLALMLADHGMQVVGVDPVAASIDVARTKAGAERVSWVVGDATALEPGTQADLVVMTGNVAQVFVSDEHWHCTLAAVVDVLRTGGWFVFETRRPEARAWENWDLAPTDITLPDGRRARVSRSVTSADLPLVMFDEAIVLGDEVLHSRSTLRFRERDEVEADLQRHGFSLIEVRQAPDRPGQEFVFLARLKGSEAPV